MADERVILNHYNIAGPYPTEWPAEKDSDVSEDEKPSRLAPKLAAHRKSRSRYSVLEPGRSDRRSLVPGSEKTRDGVENLVQRDEADPLGATDSVVRVLRQKGLPVDNDTRLRNRFLLSSTTFTPALYLSEVHSDTSTQSLLEGLEYLSRSIDQKSASLKVLVESNFERFVRAKCTIDDVYTEMRNQGNDPEVEKPRTHSRHASRNSTHFRNTSGQGLPTPGKFTKAVVNDKKKHALVKESEYGVQGIRAPLIEVVAKAEEVWGPALGGRDREESLRKILGSVEHAKGVFEVGAAISDAIKHKDYGKLAREYSRAKDYADEARNIADVAIHNGSQLTDSQVHQIVLTGRMWLGAQEQVDVFKREIWRNLTSVQANLTMSTDKSHQEDHMILITVLLEIGVEDNPIWVWLLSRYDYLKNKITAMFSRSRVEIEVLRRRLANGEKPAFHTAAIHMKTAARADSEDFASHLDTRPVLEMWELIYHSLSSLLSMQDGVLSEVIDFWNRAQSFIEGKAQRGLPVGVDGSSRKHHRLSTDGIRDLQNGAIELIELLRENVFSFFADPPIEDISALYSPVPTETPNTPNLNTPNTTNTPRTPRSTALSPLFQGEHRFRLDLLSPPPPSPKRGEPWEEFAFWPPYASTFGGVHYLGKILGLIGKASNEMANATSMSAGTEHEKLKYVLSGIRERSVRAVCVAWNKDAEDCKTLEDWTRMGERPELTRMPSLFAAFESYLLSGTQKMLYIPEAGQINKKVIVDMVTPPPSKILSMVRTQFVASLYKALSGMVENAEKPINVNQDPWIRDEERPGPRLIKTADIGRDTVDATNRSLRMLLTLSNLKALRSETVPTLIRQFEMDFSVTLTDESKKINDVVAQIDTKLFHSYTRSAVEQLSKLINAGVSSPKWPPTTDRPTEVRPYVYEALLQLVYVHTEVSTTAAPLTSSILSYLLEQISLTLLSAFRKRAAAQITSGQKLTLASLMQATLDVEFFAQTLSQYTTEKASEAQSQIYLELDKGTDQNARQKLQGELPEMRAVLKRLREGSRGEFACFRKVRTNEKGSR